MSPSPSYDFSSVDAPLLQIQDNLDIVQSNKNLAGKSGSRLWRLEEERMLNFCLNNDKLSQVFVNGAEGVKNYVVGEGPGKALRAVDIRVAKFFLK